MDRFIRQYKSQDGQCFICKKQQTQLYSQWISGFELYFLCEKCFRLTAMYKKNRERIEKIQLMLHENKKEDPTDW